MYPLLRTATLVATVAQPYDQCGGIDWTGGTACTAGWTCQYQNASYFQCIPAMSTTCPDLPKPTAIAPSLSELIPATISWYGEGDGYGGINCQVLTDVCGFYTSPGYNAAISENFFGVGPGGGAGPGCDQCWNITGQTDSSGKQLSNAGINIIVRINNLCPADNVSALCAQKGKGGNNRYGSNVTFLLCGESCAKEAFFADSGVDVALGTAVQVDCSYWRGIVVDGRPEVYC